VQVDAVEQRARDARLVILPAAGRPAATARRLAQITAAAGIHRRHKLETRRIFHMGVGARHHRLAGFDRLAQRVQYRPRELAVLGSNVPSCAA